MSDQTPLGREAILASRNFRKSEVVEIDGLGSVRVMSLNTRGSMFVNRYRDTDGAFGALFIAFVVNEDGKPVFEFTDEAVAEVMELPGDVVSKVVNVGTSLSRTAVEAEIKNSPASPTTDSPTD
jgi:hypothetical protein